MYTIGLVGVLMVGMLMSFPLVSAPPSHPCEPWPECKGGGEEPAADPAITFWQRGPKGGNKLWVMNDDGSNKAAIFQEYIWLLGKAPSWSPDGDSIAFSGNLYIPNVPSSDYGVWRIDVQVVDGVPQGTNLQRLVTAGEYMHIYDAVWSPLGNEIAYRFVYNAPELRIDGIDAVPATGGTPYNIYTAPEGHGLIFGLTWSSDGTQLAAKGGEMSAGAEGMSILIIDRQTGTVTHRLLTGECRYKYHIDWARQGSNKLLFHENGMIHTVDIDTETVVTITEGYCASWSPDNSKIVYRYPGHGNKENIKTYEFSTGEITHITPHNNYLSGLDWRRL